MVKEEASACGQTAGEKHDKASGEENAPADRDLRVGEKGARITRAPTAHGKTARSGPRLTELRRMLDVRARSFRRVFSPHERTCAHGSHEADVNRRHLVSAQRHEVTLALAMLILGLRSGFVIVVSLPGMLHSHGGLAAGQLASDLLRVASQNA